MLQSKNAKYESLIEDEPVASKSEEPTPKRCCKDILFAAVFLCGVAAMVTECVWHSEGLRSEWESTTADAKSKFTALSASKTLGASFGVAVLFSALWLLFMRFCVKLAVYCLFVMTIVAEVVGCGSLFYLSSTMESSWGRSWIIGFAVLALLAVLYTLYIVHSLCNRVALAASMMKVSGGVLKQCPSLFVIDGFLAICKFLWVSFCGATAWATLSHSEAHAFWVTTGFALMTYWGLQILANVAMVTTYGAFGSWYYGGSPNSCASFCRASTSHFGSICFGSLLVAMIETAHDVLHVLQKKGWFPSWLLCCLDRMCNAVQSAFEYINMYGFVQVAVNDESFISASKRAISFLKYKGLTALINDSIVGRMAWLGAAAGGMLSGALPVLIQRYIHHTDLTKLSLDGNQETTLATAGFLMGSFVVYTLISPVHAMATALLVCFAEHPEVLARDHEEDYKALIEPWEAVYGADFVDKAATLSNIEVESGLHLSKNTKPLHPLAAELEKLVELRDSGALSEIEFVEAKKKVLGSN